MILEQKAVQEEAGKQAARMKEAYDNASTLASIAEEMSLAKEETDKVIQGLVDSMEAVELEIENRKAQIEQRYADIDETVFLMATLDIEDEQGFLQLTAQMDVYSNQIDGWQEQNEDAERLQDQYQVNIRQVNNDLRITLAKIEAELKNAQLMVAIKNQMNIKQDI